MVRALLSLSVLVMAATSSLASAQGFDAQVLPPRFEDAVKPGAVYRNVIEIQSGSLNPARFRIRTADWILAASGDAEFEYALSPDSCRPWVGLEANEIVVDPNGRKRLRFEVAVPEGMPSGQCRFAIMIEGQPQKTANGMDVAGRIGIIVYLTIGDGAARMSVIDTRVITVEGKDVPAVTVVNDGNAHGRLEGFLTATDAVGKRWTLTPANSPILPGARRDIPLIPVTDGASADTKLTFPLQLRGQLDWGSQRIPVEVTADR
ncbi:hypothetical protein [Arenimonas alkanexedens]